MLAAKEKIIIIITALYVCFAPYLYAANNNTTGLNKKEDNARVGLVLLDLLQQDIMEVF